MINVELENELRSVFTRAAADIAVPEQARDRLIKRDYHPARVNRGLAAGITAIVAAVGIAVPLAAVAGSPNTAAGPAIRLASYTFHLPAGYMLTAATSAACRTYAIYVPPPEAAGAPDQNPPYGPGMKAAASSSGGCIVLVLAEAYTPTATVPDPEAPPTAQPVQVGRYHGLIVNSSISSGNTGRLIMRATELYVQIPTADGRMRDLVIGGTMLSKSTLIRIAANGLSS